MKRLVCLILVVVVFGFVGSGSAGVPVKGGTHTIMPICPPWLAEGFPIECPVCPEVPQHDPMDNPLFVPILGEEGTITIPAVWQPGTGWIKGPWRLILDGETWRLDDGMGAEE